MCLIILAGTVVFGQDLSKFKLYRPEGRNATTKIKRGCKTSQKEGKHVLVQAGGNWCIWCARFNEFITTDKTIDSMIVKNFVVYHLNYSKENKNSKETFVKKALLTTCRQQWGLWLPENKFPKKR